MSSYLLARNDKNELLSRFKTALQDAVNRFEYYHHYSTNNLNTLEDILALPVIERNNIMQSSLISEAMSQNIPCYFETSGTTGNPFPVLPNFADKKQFFADFMAKWLNVTNRNITRAILALPFEMNPVALKYYYSLELLNIMVIPTGVRTHLCMPEKVIALIKRLKPELIIGRPMEMLRYAEAMTAIGDDLSTLSIKKIIYTGEIMSANKRRRLSKLYNNAEVYGNYGLTELDGGGLISCNKHYYKYHLPTIPYLLVEVLNDDLKTTVKEGEAGNIIITNTEINYMPLLRYCTGDVGIIHNSCDCGMTTPAIEILGRKSDAICLTRNIFPIHIENILFNYDYISSDYQIIKNHSNLTVRVELNSPFITEREVAEKLQTDIYQALGLHVEIDVYPYGVLANKLGIAKEKAGTLYDITKARPNDIESYLKINVCDH